MFNTVRAKMLASLSAVLFASAAPGLVELILDPSIGGDRRTGWKLATAFGSVALGALVSIWASRRLASRLRQVTEGFRALAEDATTLDTIATAQRRLDTNIDAIRTLLYGWGPPVVVGDTLRFGDLLVNGSNEIVDQVQAVHGGSATIFLGDLRVSTNIKDHSGARLIGTRLTPGPVREAVLRDGKTYRGEAEIFGETYITIYEPIVVDRAVVGILFVAVTKVAAVGSGVAPRSSPKDDIDGLASCLEELRAVTAHKELVAREAMDQRSLMADARRRTEAIALTAAAAQRNVVDALSTALEKLAEADLTHRIEVAFPSEYQKLKDDFGGALAALRETMRSIMGETRSMRGHSAEIAQAVDELSRRTEQQAASLEETAAALNLITTTVRNTAESVAEARKVVGSAKSDAEHSSGVVREAVSAMSAIEDSAKQIGQIIGVIDDIALQTNLLALNAGVEAARAGDAGRGFAVVATEVRALAQRSAEAAREIKGLIQASSHQVNQGVDLVGETGRSLSRIVAQVAKIDTIVAAIAASAQEEAVSLQEVNTAVNQMDQVTQQNAAMVEESTAASHHLAQEAGKLEHLVGQFQTGAEAPIRAARTRPPIPVSSRPTMKIVASGDGGGRRPAAVSDPDWKEF